jgi:hypothetical protein
MVHALESSRAQLSGAGGFLHLPFPGGNVRRFNDQTPHDLKL